MSQVAGHGKGLDSGDLEEKIDHVYKFKKKINKCGIVFGRTYEDSQQVAKSLPERFLYIYNVSSVKRADPRLNLICCPSSTKNIFATCLASSVASVTASG